MKNDPRPAAPVPARHNRSRRRQDRGRVPLDVPATLVLLVLVASTALVTGCLLRDGAAEAGAVLAGGVDHLGAFGRNTLDTVSNPEAWMRAIHAALFRADAAQ